MTCVGPWQPDYQNLVRHRMSGVMARYNLHDYMGDQHEWLTIWQHHLQDIIGYPL